MRKNSIKNTRINSEVQKELSILIQREIKDPRIHPMTSVTDVEVATDLKTAKVYISVYGNNEVAKETLEGLKSAASYLRSQLAKRVNLRCTPELKFILDTSIEYGMAMSKLINEVVVDEEDDEYYDNDMDDEFEDDEDYDDEIDDEFDEDDADDSSDD